jgi:hypothetical protein
LRFIGLYVKTCDLCQQTKVQRSLPVGELHPLETPLERWDTLSVDFVVELPKSHSFDTIMVVVDTLGKLAHFIPTHTTVTAEGTASLFLKEVWKHHGTPLCVVSDRGPQFIAQFTRELYRLLGIKLVTSTAYHPQTDGQTEQVNQEMELFLRMFTNQRQDNWDELLPMGEFAYNNHVHSSSQQTPFMVDTSRHPRMGFKPNQPRSQVVEVREFVERMAKGVELTKAKDKYAMYYNRRRTPAPKFKPGDRVWLDSSDIHTDHPSAKLVDRALGPYKVERCVGRDTYRLTLPFSMRCLSPNFSVIKLRLAPDDPFPGRRMVPPPDPVLIDSKIEYNVEAILDSRMHYCCIEYLVKWKGYDTGHNSWEPHYNLHAPLAVAAFHRQHSGAPRSISFTAFDSLPFSHEHLSSNWCLSHQGGET